jgi:hypothetical protein
MAERQHLVARKPFHRIVRWGGGSVWTSLVGGEE